MKMKNEERYWSPLQFFETIETQINKLIYNAQGRSEKT
jgi:hypothetical protein